MTKRYTVNLNIRRVIDERGEPAVKYAKLCGFSSMVWYNIVNCQRSVYADEVVPIANALGVSVEELLRDV